MSHKCGCNTKPKLNKCECKPKNNFQCNYCKFNYCNKCTYCHNANYCNDFNCVNNNWEIDPYVKPTIFQQPTLFPRIKPTLDQYLNNSFGVNISGLNSDRVQTINQNPSAFSAINIGFRDFNLDYQ